MRLWHAVAIVAALFHFGVAASIAAPPAFEIWSDPSASAVRLDLAQLVEIEGSYAPVIDGQGAGQVFVPRATPLARLDLHLGNMRDQRPGRISIYRWRGKHAATVAQPPLWSDSIDLSGDDSDRLFTFLPRIPVEVGASYFIELEAPGRGRYLVKHSADERDHYPQGRLRIQNTWKPKWDMWFRTYTDAPPSAARARQARQGALPQHVPLDLDARKSMLPAQPPPRRSVKTTRRSYYNRVARYAHAVRQSMLNGCGAAGDEHALLEAFLYRASCEQGACKEEHARNVRDLYRAAYAWRSCGENASLPALRDPRSPRCEQVCEGKRVAWDPKRRATTAYLWTRTSGAYTPADHALVRDQLVDLGERLEGQLELGTHNRPLQLATTYRVLSDLFPEVPEAVKWRRYSDRIWRELFEAGDTSEDSTEYASVVWWPAVLEYLAVTGKEPEVFRDPVFRGWVERAYQLMTPIGPAADLGNSVGFGRDTAGWVWLFEAAGRHYREPRFRDAAQRAFRFHEGWVRDDQPVNDALLQTMGSIAWAWFAADPSVGAAPPEARREVVSNRSLVSAGHAWPVAVGSSVGQRTGPLASPLVRLSLRAIGGSATRVDARLWKWQGDLASTRNLAPVFRGEAEVGPGGAIELFPFLDTDPAVPYFVELQPLDGPLDLAGSPRASRPVSSRDGLVLSNGEEPGADLWVEAYTLEGLGSTVTMRHRVRARPLSELGPPPYAVREVQREVIPDKLVLRSGFAPDSFFAALNLVHEYEHGEAEQGAFVSIVDGGSMLLQNGPFPYWEHQRERQDESRPLLLRHSGGTLRESIEPTSIDHFRDARAVTVAQISYFEPRGWGARVERRILFAKDRFLFVRDCFAAPKAIEASLGTVWHPTDVDPTHGANWFDVFVRSPLANVRRIRNAPRRMLVYFVPRADAEIEGFRESSYEPAAKCKATADSDYVAAECRSGPPYVLTQWTRQTLPAAQGRCFDTLLIPHPTDEPADVLARAVRVVHADDRSVALELQLGEETWLVVDDASAGAVAVPGLEADVGYAIARARPGTAPYVLASDARKLRWRGFDGEWSVPVSFEIGATPGRRDSHSAAQGGN